VGGVLAIALSENGDNPSPGTVAAAPPPQPTTTAASPPATTASQPPPTTTAAAPTTTAALTPPPAAAPADPIAAAMSAISAAQAAGQLDAEAAAALERHLSDVGNGRDAGKQLDDLRRRLDHLARRGQVSQAGYDQISAAISQLASQTAGANDSPKKPHSKHA